MARASLESSDSGGEAVCARKRKNSNGKEWTGRDASGCMQAHRMPEDRGTDTKARPDRTATDVRLDTGPMRE